LLRTIRAKIADAALVAGLWAELQRRLANLIEAVENGAGATSLLEAMRAREADVQRLQCELEGLDEPLEGKLAVIPTWVRQQLEDVAGLLANALERTKSEFRRLGVAFTFNRVVPEGGQPFLRAEGTTDFAQVFPVSIRSVLLPTRRTFVTSLVEQSDLLWICRPTSDGQDGENAHEPAEA
jgi:hypothetical protein